MKKFVEYLRFEADFHFQEKEGWTSSGRLLAEAADRIEKLEEALCYALMYVGARSLTKEQSDRLAELVEAAGIKDK